jgi:hypothetical protein
MYCPNCQHDIDPVVGRYSFWLRNGGPMLYNVECQVQFDGEEYYASTYFFGKDHYTAKIIGKGTSEEEAVRDLRSKLGHKQKEQ